MRCARRSAAVENDRAALLSIASVRPSHARTAAPRDEEIKLLLAPIAASRQGRRCACAVPWSRLAPSVTPWKSLGRLPEGPERCVLRSTGEVGSDVYGKLDRSLRTGG